MLNNLKKPFHLPAAHRWDSMFDSVMGKLDLFTGEELRSELDEYNHPDMEVTDSAVIGSEVKIEMSDGREEKYYLLGAWDGDPERRFLSYRTRLGKALLNCKVGENFTGPDGKPCKLLAVAKLPDELIAELDA